MKMSLRHKREDATFKLLHWIRLGLALCRISSPEWISISCNKEMKYDKQKQTVKLEEVLIFPFSTILYVPLQTASPLRNFTTMTPKVKTFMEFACNVRKIYICIRVCRICISHAEAWCYAFPSHHVLFHVLLSLNNTPVIFEASFLCLTVFQSPLSIFCN